MVKKIEKSFTKQKKFMNIFFLYLPYLTKGEGADDKHWKQMLIEEHDVKSAEKSPALTNHPFITLKCESIPTKKHLL